MNGNKLLSQSQINALSEKEAKDLLADSIQKTTYLSVINKFATSLISLNNLDDILWYVVHHVVQELGFDDCVIYLWDDAHQRLIQRAACGHRNPKERILTEQVSLALGEGIVGNCAAEQRAIIVADVKSEPKYIADVVEAGSELSVPLLMDGEVLGVIDCENPQVGFFEQRHLDILNTVASMMASKIANSQAVQKLEHNVTELKRADKLQKALFKIASLKAKASKMENFYAQIHKAVSSLFRAENFFVAIFDEQKQTINFPYIIDHKTPINPIEHYQASELEHSLSGWVLKHNKPLLLSSRKQVEQMTHREECQLLGELAESWLGVPFQATDDCRGVVVVQSYESDFTYDDADKRLLTFVSQHIGSALARVLIEQKLHHKAMHDALTDLPNRVLFTDRLNHALERMKRRDGETIGLLYLDLDKFKAINDTYGHQVGDQFLVSVSQLLLDCVRDSDTLGRLGGDEFAILLEGLTSQDEAIEIATRIIQAMAVPIEVDGHQLQSAASIGIAFPHENTFDIQDLIRDADSAMYQAKINGRGNFQVFTPTCLNAEMELISLEDELLDALSEDQLILHFQSIMSLQDERQVAYEALLRWQHPEHGLIYPKEFVDFAEEAGIAERIDNWVLEQVCGSALIIQQVVHVNVSAAFIRQPDSAAFLQGLIGKHAFPAEHLKIEITERALMNFFELGQAFIKDVKDLGIGVLLDDFGTGFSSLSYMHKLQIQGLKVDPSIVEVLFPDNPTNSMMKSIVSLADSMELDVIAEGVESQAQVDALKSLGCGYAQGFYYHTPKQLPGSDNDE